MEPEGLTPEEGMRVLDWAHKAAAAIIIMKHHPDHSNAREGLELLNNMRNTIESIYDDMPVVLADAAYDLAVETIEDSDREEELVDDLIAELDAYGN